MKLTNFLYYFNVSKRSIENRLATFFSRLLLHSAIGLKAYGAIPSLHIHPKSTFKLGKNVILNSYDNVGWICKTAIYVRKGAILNIGDNVGISSSLLFSSNSITIGANVKIGGGTRIFDTDFHNTRNYLERRDPILDGPKAISKPIVIEDDVFIGTNCTIGKGITIGAHSIIAAGSVVTKSVPSNEVWGGNPATFIKKLDLSSNI